MPDNVQVVCVRCGQINRLPVSARLDSAHCGQCHAGLDLDRPVDVSATTLQRQIDKSGLPVVVDVWAPWCGPCRMMAPEFETAAATLAGTARLVKLNSDEEPSLSSALNIRSIPTLLIFKNGKEVTRQSGALPAHQIEALVRRTLG